ncbi:type II secretion system protein N [Chitinimonas koreensis]|uniref:type II secretion system protein N n=1 Tax=Chitinimonas koreensis TaxID=356302 RepID=UPI0004263B0B|nr:type II secretion system protein N [Chitinimonas koreensis]QNM98365.1 hypothetical protein H9L41_09095 [Chitinimonas koreensis]
MIVSLPASPWFYRCLNAALLLVVAWLLAGLVWLALTPRALPPVAAPALAAAPRAVLDLSPLNALFAPPPSGDMAPSTLDYKLRGVIASGTPFAAAVFEKPGQAPLAVRKGDELESGVRLAEVNSDHAVVDNRGRRERLELDAKPAAQGVLPADTPPPQVEPGLIAPAPPSLPPPPQVQQQVHREPPSRGMRRGGDERVLNRTALAGGMQSLNVTEWARGLADAEGGGVTVANASAQPLAGPLGLQSGDVLKSVNGAPMGRTNDISALYAAFSNAPTVTIELVRNGSPVTLRYRIEAQ